MIDARRADELGENLAILVSQGHPDEAYARLPPILVERTPFRLLDRIGAAVGTGPIPETSLFLDRVAAARNKGGWVVMASALRSQLSRDLAGALLHARQAIVAADVWYGADTVGERVPGPALVERFDKALPLLGPWRADENRWVRRAVGVAVHHVAKRSRGAPGLRGQAEALLVFLEPLLGEWEMDAAKGVGWGLKTLGRTYPDLTGQ